MWIDSIYKTQEEGKTLMVILQWKVIVGTQFKFIKKSYKVLTLN